MIGVKRQPLASPQPAAREISGKYVILVVLAVALTGAVASWFFRYNATHRAAKFWGSEMAALIRDATQIRLFKQRELVSDISRARGILHLRNALLEDRNFEWPADYEPPPRAADLDSWWLQFEDPKDGKTAWLWFTEDCKQAGKYVSHPNERTDEVIPISTEPMAAGLRTMFAEFVTNPAPASKADESPR
jgi:hypothetical protein